jgi:formylglycine-generating enzyme required for sulfatase activity
MAARVSSCRGRLNPAMFLACVATLILVCPFVPTRAQAQARGSDANVPGASEHRDQKERAPNRTRAAGEQTCPEGYVRIEPGTFTMGSPPSEEGRDDDETQHSVTISRAYCMKATEVTQGEWRAVRYGDSTGSYFEWCGRNCPVEQVSWNDALIFANQLSRKENLQVCYDYRGVGAGDWAESFLGLDCAGYRLPTEAEWEYAARAGTGTAIYTGDLTILGENNGPELNSIAWYGGNSSGVTFGTDRCLGWPETQFEFVSWCGTHPVGQKRPNAWGLFDMLGNVWEWTGDWYGAYSGSELDPRGPNAGRYRVVRGGSWADKAGASRAASRAFGMHWETGGFRLVRTMP